MKHDVVVLGAGMVGTCTAWHLRQRGHQVLLLDRRDPGEETSLGNAGLIQIEAAEPYAFPRDPAKLLQVLLGRSRDVHWRAAALPATLAPLLRYWWNSAPARHQRLARPYAALIAHCLREHQTLIDATGAQDLLRPGGYRRLYRSPAAMAQAAADAARMQRQWGVLTQIESAAELAAAEPALRQSLAGAVHYPHTGAVSDPSALVKRYAQDLVRAGGELRRASVQGLQPHGGGWRVQTDQGAVDAAQVVLAMGPWSDGPLRALGYRWPLFVKRGYHQHYDGAHGLRAAVYDGERGYLLLPMKAGLRLTTGAELALRDAPPQPTQLPLAEASARELVNLGQALPLPVWMGSRPCTADMLPVMGAAPRHPGLWFNLGHAHQGFTLGPVAGRLLAELIGGETPLLDPAPYSAARF
jgi:D-amino-acid dehydrogenase